MITLFKKQSIEWTVAALSLVLMIGCSSITRPSNDNSNIDKSKDEVTTNSNVKPASGSDSSSNNDAEGDNSKLMIITINN